MDSDRWCIAVGSSRERALLIIIKSGAKRGQIRTVISLNY
jgi:hypothetical protein